MAHLDLASIDADEAQSADLPEAQLWVQGGFPDSLLVAGGVPAVAIEIKRSTSPKLSPGYFRAVNALEVPQRYVVHPHSEQDPYTLDDGTVVIGLSSLAAQLRAEYSRL